MMIWLLLTIPSSAMLVLFCHELAHVIAAKVRGATITAFKPYPHMAGAHFRFGAVRWRYGADFRPSRWLWGAPLLADGLWLVLGSGIGALWWPALALAGAALVDAGWWVLGWLGWLPSSDLRDGQRWRNFESDPLGQRRTLAQATVITDELEHSPGRHA